MSPKTYHISEDSGADDPVKNDKLPVTNRHTKASLFVRIKGYHYVNVAFHVRRSRAGIIGMDNRFSFCSAFGAKKGIGTIAPDN